MGTHVLGMPFETPLEDLQTTLRVAGLPVGIRKPREYEAFRVLFVLPLEPANLTGFDVVGLHGPATTG